jgi:hypothetical protein
MSAGDILERLHRDGLHVRADGGKVLLSPREKVTAGVLELVRVNKAAILEALSPLPTPAHLAESAGRAVTCQACRHFTAGNGLFGQCRRYDTEACADQPFECRGYAPSPLEQRRRKVEQQLRDTPALRLAADVTDAPLRPEPGRPVSVVIAVRTAQGIVSGEFQAPRDRFDTGVFIAYLKQIPEIPS